MHLEMLGVLLTVKSSQDGLAIILSFLPYVLNIVEMVLSLQGRNVMTETPSAEMVAVTVQLRTVGLVQTISALCTVEMVLLPHQRPAMMEILSRTMDAPLIVRLQKVGDV
jgi:hypothetical protein